MKTSSKTLLYFSFFFLFINTSIAQNLTSDVDALISEKYAKDGPGISLLIAKNGKTIYKNQQGLANMELQVPINENSVFEIGSITKQFTSVSILMLEEQGKLNLNDEITKYIPDYPTKGQKITIHHLLNHTSGIKSYTAMPSFRVQDRKDMTPTELIDVFKNEPPEKENPLLKNDKVFLSPHSATFTEECLRRMAKETIQNIIDFFNEKLNILTEHEIEPFNMILLNELVVFCRNKFESYKAQSTHRNNY